MTSTECTATEDQMPETVGSAFEAAGVIGGNAGKGMGKKDKGKKPKKDVRFVEPYKPVPVPKIS